MPSRAARKRFSSISSRAGGSVPGPSGRSSSSRASDCTSADERAPRPRPSSAPSMMRTSTVPWRGCRRTSHHSSEGSAIAPDRSSASTVADPVGVAAESARHARAREGVEDGGAGRREARGPALPERRVGRQREQERQVRAQAVEESDRGAGRRDTDVDVRREGRLAAREDAHRLADLAVARMRRDDGVAPHRGRVHAGDGGAQPVAGQRARHLAAQLGELRDRVGHAAMHTGARPPSRPRASRASRDRADRAAARRAPRPSGRPATSREDRGA